MPAVQIKILLFTVLLESENTFIIYAYLYSNIVSHRLTAQRLLTFQQSVNHSLNCNVLTH